MLDIARLYINISSYVDFDVSFPLTQPWNFESNS